MRRGDDAHCRVQWHVLALSGTFWCHWARGGPACVVLVFVDGLHWLVQESERELCDKVVHGRID
jgi:hypothetical protein